MWRSKTSRAAVSEKMSKKLPLVFLDVSIDGDPAEKMVFELFSDVAPKTAENFRALCTGEKGISPKIGRPLHYKGSFFHSIIKGSMAQGGDFLKRDGSFGESIYGEKFPGWDEPPSKLKHDERGLLSMAVADRDARGSLFIITFEANHQLDRKYVVFGKLVQGQEVLKKMETVGDEDGRPSVTVKIINCGEFLENIPVSGLMCCDMFKKKKVNKLKMGKHKKSSRDRRKKRRRYYTTESDTSSDSEMESSESDTDSDSYTSSSSHLSSSSDDRRKKRKRSSKRDRYKRGKRRDKRHEKKRRRRDKRSKRQSKRASDSLTDTESESKSETRSDDNGDADVKGPDRKHKNQVQTSVGNQFPSAEGAASIPRKKGEATDIFETQEGEYPKENGQRHSNGIEVETKSDRSADRPDVVDDMVFYQKFMSRSRSISPKRTMSKSMSISPKRSLSKNQSVSRSPSVDKSPPQVSRRSRSISRSPVRSVSRSPVRVKKGRNISRSPFQARPGRSISRSPTTSPPRRRLSRTPLRSSSRKLSRKSESRSPVRVVKRSVSRSPVRSSRRSVSRSSGRAPSRRSISKSPVRAPARNIHRSYSRSPVSAGRRARSPISDRGRSSSRSPSPDGSPKRIRRGRGFSERFAYARRYRSPDRSPVRSYRYGRSDRDRYYRRSPRRYRSPPRGRTPPRYRSRISRTRSPVSRSPIRYRDRRYSRSPIRSHSPIETSRFRESPRAERQRSPPRNRSSSISRSSLDSQSPKQANKDRSRSSSGSPPEKGGLVSYGNGSPDSGQR
ncbi:unnamed protein product [Camellia sinensis]